MPTQLAVSAEKIIQQLQANLTEAQAGSIKTMLEVLNEELRGGKSSAKVLINRQVPRIYARLSQEKIKLSTVNAQLLGALAQSVDQAGSKGKD